MKKILKWWFILSVICAVVCAFLGGYNIKNDPLASDGWFKFAIIQAVLAVVLGILLRVVKWQKNIVRENVTII